MIETREMPPEDKAELFPTDAERAATTSWIRSSLRKYQAAHAGEPGRVTVRRLTSAEYLYAIRDLTGIDIKVGVDASSDSVGGKITNFGDVQFVQDTVSSAISRQPSRSPTTTQSSERARWTFLRIPGRQDWNSRR